MWRPHQADVVERILNSTKRVIIVNAPTGAGKSPIALACARILADEGKRTTILTHQKELQAQYARDFNFTSGSQLAVATGRRNWPCILEGYEDRQADRGKCVDGYECPHMQGPDPACPYYKQRNDANNSKIRILNYPMFLESVRRGKLFTPNDLVICDEGHKVDKAILEVVSTTLTMKDLAYIKLCKMPRFPSVFEQSLKRSPQVMDWIRKAHDAVQLHGRALEKSGQAAEDEIHRMVNKLENIMELDGFSAVVETEGGIAKFRPILSDQWAERLLLKHSRKTVLMSATIFAAPYWANRLGLEPEDVEYIEIPSTFPLEGRRIFYTPVVSVNNERMMRQQDELMPLIKHIDRIIAGHLPNKGIIHTVSKKLAIFIRDRSKFAQLMHVGGAEVLDDFKQSSMGVLVSYSATEGLDLPDDLCRFNIVAKVAWPPKNDPVIQVQMEEIPGFYDYEAASSMVQSMGRGNRYEGDWCNNYVLDRSAGMLMHKVKDMLPGWFTEAWTYTDVPPLPIRSAA